VMAVHPRDPNVIIVGQVPLYVSVNGGAVNSWKELSIPNAKPGPHLNHGMHSDILALLFDPADPSKLYVGTDGGIYEQIIDIVNPRPNWTYISNELVTTQFYDGGLAPKDRFLTAGGTQDNSNLLREASKRWNWVRNSGGDGFHMEFDVRSRYNSQFIYHNSYWGGSAFNGWNIYGEELPGGTRFITKGQSFFANPFRSTLAVVGPDGQLYHARNLFSSPIVNCIDPTPSNSSDRVTSVFFLKQPSLTQDHVVAGMSDGSIHLIRTNETDGGPQTPHCQDTGGYYHRKVYSNAPVPGCPRVPGAITDMALKPKTDASMQGDVIYATYTTSYQGPGRILDVLVIFNEENTAFCARDITGDLPQGSEAKHIVADPVNKDLLHLGTSQGIFVGKFIPTQSRWTWSPAPGAPPVDITFLDIQQNSDRDPGVIRTATYGRGVFELLRPRIYEFLSLGIDNQNVTSIQPSNAMSTTNSSNISDCMIREFDDPENRNRAVAVDIDYAYNSSQVENVGIRAVPTINGTYTPFFLSQIKQLEHGNASTDLLIRYVGENAPLRLSTDGIRVEMFHLQKGVFLSEICKFDLTWRSEEGRTLQIDAFRIHAEGPTERALVPINITAGDTNTTSQENTPIEYITKAGSQVNLSAPRDLRSGDETWNFSGWNVNGSAIHPDPTISIVLNGHLYVQAIYSPSSEAERPNITIRSLCNCSLENNTKTVNISMLSIPINYGLGDNVEVVYTPITLRVKSDKVFLTAPEVTQIGNVTLRFLNWNVGEQKDQANQLNRQLSLTISKDTLVTANYKVE
jgi:hypothetical protein